MSGHGRSVFLNSCIKKPLNPTNRHPNPSYLVPQCSLDRGPNDPQLQDNMNAITRKKANNKCPLARTGHQRKTKCCSITQQLRKESDNFQSLAEFYASIPDYNDLNHLPNKEFYCKLNTLRRKQKELKFACLDGFELCKRTAKSPAGLAESSTNDYNEDNDSLHSWSKSPPTVEGILSTARKSASKSVRIESTKNHDDSDSDGRNSRRKFRAGTPFVSDYEDSTKNISSSTTPINSNFVERYDRYIKRNIRSKSASPIRNYSNITIPQPYKMTQREEDERALQELLIASKNAFSSKESVNKLPSTHIKANPVPITSRIPLFDTIMADQEYRNRLARLNSEIVLQQQMKPFHFSERLNRPNSRCLSRSLSSPALLTTGFETDPAVAAKFKAKPCPKNLFSNYFYFKMWEDEYFRNMNKRLRAEELMKQASLPPSMARRERALQSEAPLNNRKSKRKRKPKRNTKRKKSTEDRGTGYFAKVGASDSHGRESAKLLYPSSNSSCSISTDTAHLPGLDATPIYPVNRPNLAATLRTEWCRKKLRELDLEEDSLQKKTPKFEWGVKKSQAFQNLTFDTTHQEELNLRLATRRAEQKLRQEEHAINMELMRQRVKAAPLLLEGPPQWGPRLGHVAHRCLTSGSRSSDPLFHKSTKNRSIKKIPSDGRRRNSTNDSRIGNEHHQSRSSEKQRFSSSSKLSNYSLDSFGQNSSKFCDSDILCKVDDELDSFTGEV